MDLVIARELEIYGSHGMAARDYPAMMRMVADGTLRPGLLVGDVIGLEDAGRALAAMSGLSAMAGMTVVKLPPGTVISAAPSLGTGGPPPRSGLFAQGPLVLSHERRAGSLAPARAARRLNLLIIRAR